MECGDESTAKLLCCGGNDYHMVKDYLGTLTAFRGVVFSWFKGTTILSCLRCKGNMLREMQAVLLAQMWITAVQMVVVAAVVFFYFAKNSIDSCKNAEMGHVPRRGPSKQPFKNSVELAAHAAYGFCEQSLHQTTRNPGLQLRPQPNAEAFQARPREVRRTCSRSRIVEGGSRRASSES
eukprot:TRINITY_DN18760_c0_g2_i2.p1 TRINITY_DN18760_c0_g2~~TRINITY_DN18760_c0_g2_i2.p1  ORF type:complete len:179 (+),score=22.66 TRINITY_DN18760_c0_g2_i2:133-669(+)